MTKVINLLNAQIHNLSMAETILKVEEAIQNKSHLHHSVVNAGKIVAMQNDRQLRESVNSADIVNADGQAVIWASKILKQPLKERVAGIDLMSNLIEIAAKKNYKIFFLGAEEHIVKSVVEKYQNQYSKSLIAGYRNGYFSKSEELKIAKQISDSEAQILFVAMSSPKKENFLFDHSKQLQNINFIMGVGGSFDVVAGKVKRAPQWMQKSGLEWLYRVIQEPKRMWKRYLIGNTKFIFLVLKAYLKP
ncbi:MAG: WecB/TagA/CpsF family glycosyltransferase [Psychroflexus sp.]